MPGRFNTLLHDDPNGSACANCGGAIVPFLRDCRAWVHFSTNLLRCVGTHEITVAEPADGQLALEFIGTEAA